MGIKGRIQQVQLFDALIECPLNALQQMGFIGKGQTIMGFIIVAVSAAVRASPLGFEKHHIFNLGLQQILQIGARTFFK